MEKSSGPVAIVAALRERGTNVDDGPLRLCIRARAPDASLVGVGVGMAVAVSVMMVVVPLQYRFARQKVEIKLAGRDKYLVDQVGLDLNT